MAVMVISKKLTPKNQIALILSAWVLAHCCKYNPLANMQRNTA